MKPRIVILGGGFAGMFAARQIHRKIGHRAEVELITEDNYFVFQPLLPEVAAGAISAVQAVSPLRFLLRDVFVRKARVESVDFEARKITLFQGVQRRPTLVSYDHIVVALGQKVDLSRTPGLADHGLTLKTLGDARRLRAHVIERLEHAEVTNLPEVKREALTFTVIGGGFSGVEAVGEMKELIDRALHHYPNIAASEVRVLLLEFADRILGEMPAKLSDYATAHLRKRGIDIRLKTGIASATGTSITTTDGERIGTRTVVATIGNAPSPVVLGMGLPLDHGRIAVERTLAVRGVRNVWSLGDCALIPMVDNARDRGDFAPPTAQFAVREARHLAENLKAAIDGRALQPFDYTSKGAMASLGARRGVANVFGINLTGMPAWLLWRAYYLGFLPGMATRVRVLLNWLLDGLAPRSVVQIDTYTPPPARYQHFAAGDRIYETGNRADGFYAVISGEVEVDYPEAYAGPRLNRRIGPGAFFGERILLGQDRRVASVRAVVDTKVLLVDRGEFLKLADGFTDFRHDIETHLHTTYGEGPPPASPPA
jgi:NADH dehydrogenase